MESSILGFLVEATGLEPTTFWSLTKRATKLRYASICYAILANSITYYTHTLTFSQAFLRFFYNLFYNFSKNINFLFCQGEKGLTFTFPFAIIYAF